MISNIYILLPVHNRKYITELFIDCLVAQTYQNYHLLLIDDGSTDGTDEMVRAKINNLTVLKGNGNWWWAGSLQQGINWLKARRVSEDALILFINDDVHFLPDFLERASRVMVNKKNVLMLSRFFTSNESKISESGVCADLKKLTFKIADSSDQINCLSTRGLFVHWQVIKAIGGFYPRLLPHYLSDYEFTIRAYRKGYQCESSEELLIEPNYESTGYHQVVAESFGEFFIKLFSKKSPGNPIYLTSFILLTSNLVDAVPNLINVWMHTGKSLTKAFLR